MIQINIGGNDGSELLIDSQGGDTDKGVGDKMIQINIGGNDGSELLIDSQGGDVCFTVIVPKNSDRTQYDFGIESHEWELLKVFLDKQKELEAAARAGMVAQEAK